MIIIGFGVIIAGLMVLGVVFFIFMGLMSSSEKKTQRNSDQILDEAFDGKETAVYKISSLGGLKFEQVLAGGEQRGYSLHAQNESKGITTMVFKKTHDSARQNPVAVKPELAVSGNQTPGQGKFFDVKPPEKELPTKTRLLILGGFLLVIIALPFILNTFS